jgi:hypothetical protein
MARRDEYNRRLYPTQEKALAAQYRAVRDHGVWSGVVRTGKWFHLIYDPEA